MSNAPTTPPAPMGTMRCPDCGADDAIVYTSEYAVCPHCKKLLVPPPPSPACKNCGSTELLVLSEEYAVCQGCKTLVLLTEDSPAPAAKVESVPAPMPADSQKPVSISCTSCGSSDVRMIHEELGECNHCGAKISIPHAADNVIVHNEVHIHGKNGVTPELFMAVPEVSLEDFPRSALLTLASFEYAPPDVFEKGSFDLARRVWRQIVIVDADVSVSYSAMLGHDRQEKYKERDVNGNYVEKTRKVKQT